MRDLKELRVRYLLSLSFIAVVSLSASTFDENISYLTKEKQKILEIDKEINKKSATSLKYDWIEPIVASYSYSKSNQAGEDYALSKYFRISFDQPIFKSGGIYFAIEYSKANRAFKDITYHISKKALIKSLYDGVLNLKKLDLEIKKVEYSIKNAKIDIQRKTEQFNSGLLDSSFLDSAILNKTKLSHQLLTLKSQRFTAIENFKNISDVEYNLIVLPKLKVITRDEFISKNLDIKSLKEQKDQSRELKNMTISNYLPTLSLFGSYNYKDDEIQFFKQSKEYKNYGLKLSMPIFAINRGRDIEIKKLEYLKAKIKLKEQKEATVREFLALQNSIDILGKRIDIAKDDIRVYNSLVKSAEDGLLAGEKTKSDVETLKNSKKIASFDAKIYEIDRELEILKLYEKMSDEI